MNPPPQKHNEVMKMNEPIKLTDEMADKILESLENPPKPSEYLKEAKRVYERDIEQSTDEGVSDD